MTDLQKYECVYINSDNRFFSIDVLAKSFTQALYIAQKTIPNFGLVKIVSTMKVVEEIQLNTIILN